MNFLVLFKILGALERFLAYLAYMRLQRSVDSKMACDVITFGTGGSTVLPFASETKIICALSADMVVAEMIIEDLWISEADRTIDPLAVVGFRV